MTRRELQEWALGSYSQAEQDALNEIIWERPDQNVFDLEWIHREINRRCPVDDSLADTQIGVVVDMPEQNFVTSSPASIPADRFGAYLALLLMIGLSVLGSIGLYIFFILTRR
jgi:hypothetical protein